MEVALRSPTQGLRDLACDPLRDPLNIVRALPEPELIDLALVVLDDFLPRGAILHAGLPEGAARGLEALGEVHAGEVSCEVIPRVSYMSVTCQLHVSYVIMIRQLQFGQ